MADKKYVCTKCGKLLNENQKFCTTCGTKNEFLEVNKSVDSNIFNEPIEVKQTTSNNSDAIAVESSEKLDETFIDNNKLDNKSKKNYKKVYIPALIVVGLLLIGLVGFKIFLMFSPNYSVKIAFLNTYKYYEKENNNFNKDNNITNMFYNFDGDKEKELELQFKDLNLGDNGIITNSIKNVIKDLEVNIKTQLNKKCTNGYYGISVQNNSSDFISGDFYFDEDKIVAEIPKLLDDLVGINFNRDNEDIKDSENKIDKLFNSNFYNIEDAKNINEKINSISKKYANYLLSELDFEKEKKDSYTAKIEGNKIIELVENFVLEILNDEEIKNYIIDCMYASDSQYSKQYYIDLLDSIKLRLPDEIEYLKELIQIDDIIVNVSTSKNKISYATLKLNIINVKTNENVKIQANLDCEEEKNNREIRMSLKFGTDILNTISTKLSFEETKKEKNRTFEIECLIKETGDNIKFLNNDCIKSDKTCENNIDIIMNTYNENIKVSLKTEAEKEGKDRLNIDNIHISMFVDDVNISLDLKGYIQNNKIRIIKNVNDKKILYLNDMDEIERNDLLDTFKTKFINKFELLFETYNNMV
ncbi:zinc ribbon domain-containing protein [Sedimentibacter sp. zth1]|uniref:zinc ribbon domain-containing protein n=1 Tax=Sedimentibacter sp. zth1 TaxID=2816908 RepID=UPI001A91B690|nr:zinc ribbon domain-containing protein [Sedimentibacter sp. zth1]QSX05169.1 zinc ribbon domain-containing protein [Sedimentibacter sp. zth1]